ncbi:MAG: hypothetical protein OXH57_08000 [Ekhidna sp.]|nr:hypothetical protein [Ekhidna sp.]
MKIFRLKLLAVIILSSCGKDDSTCCTNFDITVNLAVKSDDNKDLLNPNNAGSYKLGDIKVQYLVDNALQNPSKGLEPSIIDDFNQYLLRITADPAKGSPQTITLSWGSLSTDTLLCELSISNNSTSITSVHLNGNRIWLIGDGARNFTLFK